MAFEYLALAIILIIGIIVITFYVIKKQNYNNIEELKDRRQLLMEGLPNQRMDEARALKLSGESKDYLDNLEKEWQRINSGKNITIENHLIFAEQATERFNFREASKNQKIVHRELGEIESDLKGLSSSLDDLIQRQPANIRRMEEIKARFTEIREELLTHNLDYGLAVEELENKLDLIEDDYQEYQQLTDSGDHEKARKKIFDLEKKLEEMEIYMHEIPSLLDQINNDFEEQLVEVQEGHDYLVNNGYVIPGHPIPNNIAQVRDDIEELKQTIGSLKIERSKNLAGQITDGIEMLYTRLQTEIDARSEISNDVQQIQKAINYLTEETRILFFEIDRVSQSYVLVHNESERVYELKDEIEEVDHTFQSVMDNLDRQLLAFSEALEDLVETKDKLDEINQKKDDVTHQLYNYRNEEVELKEELSHFEKRLDDFQAQVGRERLPGVPQEYLDYFDHVDYHVNQFADELNRPKLKIEKIYELREICIEDIEMLSEMTKKLIDHALLTEIFAQKLYKYREEYPDVMEAINQSEIFFTENFDYESSMRVLKNKFDTIEPGVSKEIIDNFQANR